MIKKIVLISCLTLSQLAQAIPATPYIGAGLGVINNTTGWSNFRGVPLTLYAGYGGPIADNFNLNLELFGSPGTMELTDNGYGHAKSTYSYGISILPGFILTETSSAFARVGLIRTRFSYADRDDWFNWDGETLTGAMLGLGLQSMVTPNVDVRGEYNYINFWTSSRRSDLFNLSFIYKF